MSLLLLEACRNLLPWKLADGRGDGCYIPDVDGSGYGVPYLFITGNGFGTGMGTEGSGNGDFTPSINFTPSIKGGDGISPNPRTY